MCSSVSSTPLSLSLSLRSSFLLIALCLASLAQCASAQGGGGGLGGSLVVSATATASLTRPGSNAVFYTDSNNQQHPLEAQVDFAANNKVEINTDQAGTTFHVTWGMWLYIPNGQGQTEMLDSWPVPAPFDGDITVGMAGHWEESHTLSAGPFWYPIGDYYASTTASILVNGNTGELKQSGAFFHVQLGS